MPCDSSYMYEDESPKYIRMLCGLCQRVEEAGLTAKYINPDPTLADWWAAHKKSDRADQARLAADVKRKKLADAAKKKLTRAEREALGIR